MIHVLVAHIARTRAARRSHKAAPAAAAITVALTIAAAVASCRQILGVDERALCSMPDIAEYAYPDATCAMCAAGAACCAKASACSRDRECLALSYCVWPCSTSDTACRTDCENRYRQESRTAANALGACLATACGTECALASP